MLAPDQAFSKLAGVYDDLDNPVSTLGLNQIRRMGSAFAGRDVLDLGCGRGAPAREAAEFGSRSWIGVDRVGEMLENFSGVAVGGDFEALPFNASSFDVVLFWISLGYANSLGVAIRESSRVLRTGGRLFILDLHPRGRELGWTRNIGGIAIRSVIHSNQDWARSFTMARLEVLVEETVSIDESLRPCFDRAGRNFSEFEGHALLIFFELSKRDSTSKTED